MILSGFQYREGRHQRRLFTQSSRSDSERTSRKDQLGQENTRSRRNPNSGRRKCNRSVNWWPCSTSEDIWGQGLTQNFLSSLVQKQWCIQVFTIITNEVRERCERKKERERRGVRTANCTFDGMTAKLTALTALTAKSSNFLKRTCRLVSA